MTRAAKLQSIVAVAVWAPTVRSPVGVDQASRCQPPKRLATLYLRAGSGRSANLNSVGRTHVAAAFPGHCQRSPWRCTKHRLVPPPCVPTEIGSRAAAPSVPVTEVTDSEATGFASKARQPPPDRLAANRVPCQECRRLDGIPPGQRVVRRGRYKSVPTGLAPAAMKRLAMRESLESRATELRRLPPTEAESSRQSAGAWRASRPKPVSRPARCWLAISWPKPGESLALAVAVSTR